MNELQKVVLNIDDWFRLIQKHNIAFADDCDWEIFPNWYLTYLVKAHASSENYVPVDRWSTFTKEQIEYIFRYRKGTFNRIEAAQIRLAEVAPELYKRVLKRHRFPDAESIATMLSI